MEDLDETYPEQLLHWIWESLHFELQGLHTFCGQPVTVLDTGILNSTDGPDFTNARLQIGELQWHGDVEFHWSISDWNRHGHHTDPRYNRVILHVVYHDPGNRQIKREDGTQPFTLHLRPHLPDNLDDLLSSFHQNKQLPCSGQIRYISDQALEQQFERAHREYFESKSDFLLKFYDPNLPPATAWKRVLALGLFDGLGISLNREPMLEVGRELYEQFQDHTESFVTPAHLQQRALQLGGFAHNNQRPLLPWNFKGCRPTNRPELRLKQAASLLWEIENTPFEQWYKADPAEHWKELLSCIDTETGIGRERSDILYGIAFLPALWLLGSLFRINSLKQKAFDLWMAHDAQLPSSLFRLFARSGIPSEVYRQRLGAVYQLKHYCKARRCSRCIVLKELISS